MSIIFRILFLLAMLGFALCAAVCVQAIYALKAPDPGTYFPLLEGLPVIWLPTVLTLNWMSKDFKRKDFWKAALRGCPGWVRWFAWGFFAFAFVSALLLGPNGFLPMMMAAYLICAATMLSAANVVEADPARRCPNGHVVTGSATYCPDCGALTRDEWTSNG